MSVLASVLRKPAILSCALFSAAVLLPVGSALAQKTAVDNSARNQRQTKTADQQSESAADRDLTAQIRRSIVSDKSLSTYGHNVKIITVNGMVTLKGPVHSDDEKQAIMAKATAIAGPNKVGDQLTVKK